ncbi:histamine H2 receptor [Tachyglossus aculeatus]|uniref:histamine H2 receptor n=1 Tax=Tachyglossus aculeatus TaxID=9261 RepID=UPI0018F510AB|nr:histamine H2 receptor [Tachyglossus aculeatus]
MAGSQVAGPNEHLSDCEEASASPGLEAAPKTSPGDHQPAAHPRSRVTKPFHQFQVTSFLGDPLRGAKNTPLLQPQFFKRLYFVSILLIFTPQPFLAFQVSSSEASFPGFGSGRNSAEERGDFLPDCRDPEAGSAFHFQDGIEDEIRLGGGVILGTLILVVIGGNVVVCLAVGLDRRLHSPTNCFTVSLAVTDLLLGILVLPLSAISELRRTWLFSRTLCDIHTSLDVMLCTTSILNLFMISLDRYYAITAPLRYPALVTPSRVGTALAGIWTVSLLFSFLPIHLGWNAQDAPTATSYPPQCKLQVNKAYGLVDALVTFYIPLLVMGTTYYRIFKIAREQAKRINQARGWWQGPRPGSPAAKEHKATVTLAAVMGTFIVCWFPYFTVFVYRGVKGDEAVDKTLEAVVLWLGYANSALNPLLYAALNRDFRAAYRRLLSCHRARTSAHLESSGWREKRSPGLLVRIEAETSLGPGPPDRKAVRPWAPAPDNILSCCKGWWRSDLPLQGTAKVPGAVISTTTTVTTATGEEGLLQPSCSHWPPSATARNPPGIPCPFPGTPDVVALSPPMP